MTCNDNQPNKAALRRQQAEAKALQNEANSPENFASLSPEVIQQMFHELRVRQIELEMENEELRASHAELNASRAHCFELLNKVQDNQLQGADEAKRIYGFDENRLRVSEVKYRTLFDVLPFGITVTDDTGNIVEINHVAELLLGLSKEEHTRRRIDSEEWKIIRKDGSFMPADEYAGTKALKENRIVENVEMGIVKEDNNVIWLNVTAVPLPLVGFGVLITYNDITERKQIEEQLESVKWTYEQILEQSMAGYWDWTIRENNEYLSPSFKKMFGYEDNEMENSPDSWQKIIFPEDLPGVFEVFNRHIESHGLSPFYNEVRYRHKDGSTVWVICTGKVIQWDKYGQAIRMVGCHINITERKLAEEELRESEERFKLLHNASFGGIAIHDKGIIFECNQGLADMTGYTVEELTGGMDGLLLISEKSRNDVMNKILSGYEKPYEAIGLRKNGEEYPMRLEARNVPYKGKIIRTVEFRDITEHKRDEAALLETNARHTAMIENIGDVIGIVGSDGIMKYKSPNIERWFGWKPEDLVGSEGWETVHPDDVDLLQKEFSALLEADNATTKVVYRYKCKDGTFKWIELIAINCINNPAINGVLLNYHDVTVKKQAEEVLRESETKHRRLIQNLNVGVVVHSPDTRILLFNPLSCTLLGLTPEQMDGRAAMDPQWSFVNENGETMALHDYPVYQVLANRAPLVDFVLGIDRPENSGRTWVSCNAYPEFNEKQQIQQVVVTFADITERKRAEDALHTKSEEQSWLLKSMMNAFVLFDSVFDAKGNFVSYRFRYINDTYERITGVKQEEVFGKTVHEVWPETEASWVENYGSVAMTGKTLSFDMFHKPTAKHYHCTVYRPWDINEQFCVVSDDITERKQVEEEKEKLHAQLAQAQKMESVGRLAGGVAHDFNNMLGVILGHAEMALDQVDPAQPLFDDLHEVRKAAERSAELTRQLLTFARKQIIAPKVIDLNETVEGMLKMLRRLIGEDIDLAWLPGNNLKPVKVDPSQIDQILVNLCVNARDAIEDVGKVTIETGTAAFDETYCADNAGFVQGEYVLLAVSDNGCGMDTETLGHLFEPFFTTKEMGKGTGLGLATVYGAVKQNNGFIKVYSEPGLGTTFKVYLPQHEVRTASPLSNQSSGLPAERGHETILLVEDEPSILKMTTMMLEKQGYTVVPAPTPGEAIRLAHEHIGRIDLLMTDVVMPEMNGRDLAGNLLSFYPDLKRLFMSGYTANVIAHHGVLDEGVHFIQKPFSRKDLAAKLREALG